MKSPFNYSTVLLALAIGLLAPRAGSAATLTVTPSAVSSAYTGVITLNVGGLTNHEQVQVRKFIDADGNGVADPGDPLVDSFKISDGGAMVIGGITNLSVPFDSNSATGAITTTISIAPPRSLENLVGQFVFQVSSPTGNFSPVTATLTITNASLAQSLNGVVYSGVAPMPHAVVAILTPQGDGARWVTGVIADNTGHYRATVPPGTYMLMPTWPGYFTDRSLGAQVTLTNGMSATNDLFLTNGIVTISGTVYDAGNSNGLGGVLMPIEGGNFFAITFTDTNGFFTAGVAPASWKVKVEADAVAQRAYVTPGDNIQVDTTTGSVANVNFALSKGNALIYGTFTNAAGGFMANVGFSAQDNSNQYKGSGITDANGNYFVAVLGGSTWFCNPDNSDPALAGYIVSSSSNTNVSVGQAVRANLVALAATAQISGHVQDRLGNPIVGIGIIGGANIGGIDFSTFMDTDSSGNYSMSAGAGTWNIFPNCCGNDGLEHFNLMDPGGHVVTIPPTNAVVNLVLYPYGTPALSQPMRFGPSTFGFNLSGAQGTNYTIQVSTNLGNWSTLLVTNLPSNFLFIFDDHATNGQRFYRVLMGP
jgi:hypothetical protein